MRMRVLGYLLLGTTFFVSCREHIPGVYCSAPSDCPLERPLCDTTLHTCYNISMGCQKTTQATDCMNARPICGDDNMCRKCQSHDECPANICKADGSCAAATEIAYVNNAVTCTDTVHESTITNPYCQIAAAVKDSGKFVIRIVGGGATYTPISITSGSFTIIATNAEISGDLTNPAIAVSGATTNVAIEGIKVKAGGSGQHGIACSSTSSPGPTVTIRQSVISGVGGAGVSASQCTITLDRMQVGPNNSGGGIKLTDSKYSITNSFIVGNNSASPAVSFSNESTPIEGGFIHNTIVGNGGVGTVGGIRCSANASTQILNSVIFNNSKMGSSQFSGNCVFSGSLIDDGTSPAGTGNRNAPAPDFVSTSDFRLNGKTINNLACCIDQIDSSPVDHDFDGTKRPQGPKWDTGAHEVGR